MAQQLTHPCDVEPELPESLKLAIFQNLTQASEAVEAHREAFLVDLQRKKEALREEEKVLHAGMDQGVRKVMEGKALLLLLSSSCRTDDLILLSSCICLSLFYLLTYNRS